MPLTAPRPFLRIPPFPGHRAPCLTEPGIGACDPEALTKALRAARVGGSFWAAQPVLAKGRRLLLAPDDKAQLAVMLTEAGSRGLTVLPPPGIAVPAGADRLASECDPWWLADQADEVWCGAGQELALVCALAGTPLRIFGDGPFAGCAATPEIAAAAACNMAFRCPFTGSEWDIFAAIAQLADWRRLIDANRAITAVLGVAAWKRVSVSAMLWSGSGQVPYSRGIARSESSQGLTVVWKSRTSRQVLDRLAASGGPVGEIEDGFIRSAGLGANCVPPLSVIVDRSGIYFDPSQPSDLETLLETFPLDPSLRSRASALKERLVQESVSKYGQGGVAIARPADGRRRVLVTGQVEDDRSILSGGAGQTNLDLIRRTRELEPDAWIIYKPHPDVEAGHRKGHVPESEALRFADEVRRDDGIVPLIESVDALHVITSLAGFEALLRGKEVTAHGTPFYAGWGLTRDLAPVPERRSRQLSVDDLVALTLLIYPRYFDPVTRLPCPAEIVVERMAKGQGRMTSPLIRLREWQGRLRLLWRRLAGV